MTDTRTDILLAEWSLMKEIKLLKQKLGVCFTQGTSKQEKNLTAQLVGLQNQLEAVAYYEEAF